MLNILLDQPQAVQVEIKQKTENKTLNRKISIAIVSVHCLEQEFETFILFLLAMNDSLFLPKNSSFKPF